MAVRDRVPTSVSSNRFFDGIKFFACATNSPPFDGLGVSFWAWYGGSFASPAADQHDRTLSPNGA
jgi:hypothetical protein